MFLLPKYTTTCTKSAFFEVKFMNKPSQNSYKTQKNNDFGAYFRKNNKNNFPGS